MDFLCRDIAGKAHKEECRGILYSIVTLIKQMALEPCRNILQLCRDIRNEGIRRTLSRQKITLSRKENGKTMRQCAYDKVFYVATDITTKDKTKADFMSRQKKTMSRHNI